MTLTANIITTAITEASLRGQIAVTWSLIAEEERVLRILRQQSKLGGVAGSEVLTQATQLAQTRATLPPLQKSLGKKSRCAGGAGGRFAQSKSFTEILFE